MVSKEFRYQTIEAFSYIGNNMLMYSKLLAIILVINYYVSKNTYIKAHNNRNNK